jgi:hypothetical protein
MLSFFGWWAGIWFVTIYIVCLFTVAVWTFRKGYVLLGILGIFWPVFWLIGAILPAKPNSRYAIQEGIQQQAYIAQATR